MINKIPACLRPGNLFIPEVIYYFCDGYNETEFFVEKGKPCMYLDLFCNIRKDKYSDFTLLTTYYIEVVTKWLVMPIKENESKVAFIKTEYKFDSTILTKRKYGNFK